MSADREWVRSAVALGNQKTLCQRIVKDGRKRGRGKDAVTPGVSDHVASVLLELTYNSGIRPGPGRLFLIDILRWHLGLDHEPIPPAALTRDEAAFIRRRAYMLADTARDRLPALENDREAR